MVRKKINIDDLIAFVNDGGSLKTGVDIYNSKGTLLLDKDILVDSVNILKTIKQNGIRSLYLSFGQGSGIWDKNGTPLTIGPDGGLVQDNIKSTTTIKRPRPDTGQVEKRLHEIQEMKIVAARKYENAKTSIKKVLFDIKSTGGEFNYSEVEKSVGDLVEFLTGLGNPFSYLTREIFSYDDYLYNHSINVCAIGTAVINRFNSNFSALVNQRLDQGRSTKGPLTKSDDNRAEGGFKCFLNDDLNDICIGFFLHDIGKVMIPDDVLNKAGLLSPEEFNIVKRHSFDLGVQLLDKNKISNPFVRKIVIYHHAAFFDGEERCYPDDKLPGEIPPYVKMCKLADIYDAMTSKRCYKEAFNPINVVTGIFRKYAKKESMLQVVLHAFVKSIGIYPPGSILYLKNGQMAYVLDSEGPFVLPFTDTREEPLTDKSNPIDLSMPGIAEPFKPDNNRSLKTPLEVYHHLPSFLKSTIQSMNSQ